MASILLVAHKPLATALQAVASHAFEESSARVQAVDIAPTATLAEAEDLVHSALADLTAQTAPDHEVLVLADAFGATPCNAALASLSGTTVQVVAGVNVSMLWRSLCYAQLPLAELVIRALEGGREGIMRAVRATPPDAAPPAVEP